MAAISVNLSSPSEIRVKLDLLRRQEKIVEDLANKLEAARLEHNRLEAEIECYLASIAPIQKCPEEVLLTIFEYFSEQNPKTVTRLLPVCKQWYSFAMTDPQLWNHITIEIKDTWNLQTEALRCNEQARACLQRSASLPLHIALDFTELRPMSKNLLNHLTNLFRNSILTPKLYTFGKHLRSLDLEALMEPKIYAACRPMHVLEPVSLLVGERGEGMKRWGTINILFPFQMPEMSKAIWKLLCGATPNLTKFCASDLSTVQKPIKFIPHINSFPDLSSLEELDLEGTMTGLDRLTLNFSSIKRLSLHTNIRLHHDSLRLSRFALLQSLHISCYDEIPANLTMDPMGKIRLPLLQRFILQVNQGTGIHWDVPVLQELKIFSQSKGDIFPELPDVRTLRFHWVGWGQHLLERVKIRHALQKILSKYSPMQRLTLPPALSSTWDELIHDLREMQEEALPVVMFAGPGEYIGVVMWSLRNKEPYAA